MGVAIACREWASEIAVITSLLLIRAYPAGNGHLLLGYTGVF